MHSPMPAAAPVNTTSAPGTKSKKVIIKLPVESIQPLPEGTDTAPVVYSMWSRQPLPHAQAPKMNHVDYPEVTSMGMHPIEQSNVLPATIDVFLPGKVINS